MQVFSVQLWLLGGFLVISSAHHGQQHPEATVKAKGVAEKWPIPQSAIEFGSFINQTASNSTKPSGGAQLLVPFPSANDPQVQQAPFAYKPNRPNVAQHLLSNVQGSNIGSSSFFVIPSSTTTETSADAGIALNDPLPNPLPGIINASQATVSNTSSAVQEITSLWNTNVQNGFFGSPGNRPSSDEGSASGSTPGSSNPLQGIIDNSQASLNNATGVAQGIAGQFGANVQNGLTNIFGINLNLPSNDEPVAQSTEAAPTTLAAPTTGSNIVQSLAGQFGSNVQNGLSSILGVNLNRPSNDEAVEQSTEGASTTTQAPASSETTEAATTTASAATFTTSGGFFPLVSFVNNTQSLVNSSQLVQAVTGSLSASFQQGLAPLFFPRPGSKNSADIDAEMYRNSDGVAVPGNTKSTAPPTPPSCPTCPSMCYYRPFQRIVDATDVASSTKYPFIALLTYLDSPSGQGSLINDRTIVTTASVIETMPIPMHIRALLGLYNRADSSEVINTLEITTTYVHPGYNTANPLVDNIGLLILTTPLTSFSPICLPAPNPSSPPVPKATIIGWGSQVANGPLANILQEAEITLYASLICQMTDLRATPKNLCGGTIRFTSNTGATCTGDGGDPLVVMKATTWELIGVALDIPGIRCGEYRTPAMFTSIIPYLDWITTYGPGCECYIP
ncbi:mucin-5AC-like isoform X1 [Anopheles stephensi]|uniref:mucin-5AC-like isoform X1 n=1 Tax=Anopheles stephensi TaxID=30069 RepID=UPI001658BB72|nr:mucin-5AC-like isoform X1 [Anopheles stephensi]